MKGHITTKRVPFHWRRWEATRELSPGSWVVAYGITRRAALRNLREGRVGK